MVTEERFFDTLNMTKSEIRQFLTCLSTLHKLHADPIIIMLSFVNSFVGKASARGHKIQWLLWSIKSFKTASAFSSPNKPTYIDDITHHAM